MRPVPGVTAVLAQHEAAGRRFAAGGINSFVREEGAGEAVVLIHGLPASSFLYRKVIHELAGRGYHALSFDLPGLGLADRSPSLDYTIAGLAAFAAQAVDALGVSSFHLVVHDAGGPVGFELCRMAAGRVRSLTILNTAFALSRVPYPGELLARLTSRVRGPLTRPDAWRLLMRRVGVADMTSLSDAELDAWRVLALGDDQGAGYLRIMSHLRAGSRPPDYRSVVDSRTAPYPVGALWGALDPILPLRRQGLAVLAATHLTSLSTVAAKHYLQEDQAPAVAELIASTAALA